MTPPVPPERTDVGFNRRGVRIVRIPMTIVWLAVSCGAPASAATIVVPAGGDLHAALVNARPGDTIALEPGAVYVGNFTLPDKGGTAWITIRPAGSDIVPEGTRITPAHAAGLPKLRSPNNQPVVQTARGAHHWRLVLLELEGGGDRSGDILALGDGSAAQSALSHVPRDLVVDRVLHPRRQRRRPEALRGAQQRRHERDRTRTSRTASGSVRKRRPSPDGTGRGRSRSATTTSRARRRT